MPLTRKLRTNGLTATFSILSSAPYVSATTSMAFFLTSHGARKKPTSVYRTTTTTAVPIDRRYFLVKLASILVLVFKGSATESNTLVYPSRSVPDRRRQNKKA